LFAICGIVFPLRVQRRQAKSHSSPRSDRPNSFSRTLQKSSLNGSTFALSFFSSSSCAKALMRRTNSYAVTLYASQILGTLRLPGPILSPDGSENSSAAPCGGRSLPPGEAGERGGGLSLPPPDPADGG